MNRKAFLVGVDMTGCSQEISASGLIGLYSNFYDGCTLWIFWFFSFWFHFG